MQHTFDMIVIGGGPAGYTAALYGARAGLDTLVVEKLSAGGQMALTGTVDNYPGFDAGIDGFTLGMKMQAGAERFGAKTQYEEVTAVDFSGEIKQVMTSSGILSARTVVIATGADPRKLGIEGEDALVGRGLCYCAHCDGRFYKGKTVLVVGGGNTAVEDALYLSHLAEKVILVHRRDTLRAAKIAGEALLAAPNVTFVWNSTVSGFLVQEKIVGARLQNQKDGTQSDIACDGIFVSIGRVPATQLFAGAVALDEHGYIVADESTATNIPGVFAAGDVRAKDLRQIVTAVSDGANAAHAAEIYLSSHPHTDQ